MHSRILLALTLSLPAVAFAQNDPDADLEPAVNIGFNAHDMQIASFDGDVRDPFLLQRPDYMERGDFWFGGVYEYANEPLVRYFTNDDPDDELLRLTSGIHINTGFVLDERLRIDASVPVFLNARDRDGIGTRAALGDTAVTALINLVTPVAEDEGLGLGLTTRVSFNTGAEKAGLGEDGIRVEPGVAATYPVGPITLTGNVGIDIRPSVPERGGYTNSNRLTTGLGVGYAFSDMTGVTLEGRLAAPFSEQERPGQATPSELYLSGRQRTNTGLHFVGGGAVGIGPGVGAAEWRLFAGLGLARRQDSNPDPDGDGILGDADQCPTRAETINSWQDMDGCPDELASIDIDTMADGRNIADAVEYAEIDGRSYYVPAGGILPGAMATGHSEYGCGIGMADMTLSEGNNTLPVTLVAQREYTVKLQVEARDGSAVPTVEATWDNPPWGCTSADAIAMTGATGEQMIGDQPLELFINAQGYRPVRLSVYQQDQWADDARTYKVLLRKLRDNVTVRQMEVTERVLFALDKAVLRPESVSTLDEVAAEIKSFASNVKVEVEGHTDYTASERYNQGLSERRAQAVVDYLVSQGVDRSKLVARGFGESEPVATNSTPEGRQLNRRVVFTVVTPK